VWIATVGGVGFGPWAPGTWGSLLAGVVFCLGLHRLDAALYGLCLVGLAGLGVWASTAAERYFGRHDDGRIVIDEFVGQLIALFPLVLLHEVSLGGLRIPGLESTPARNIDFWWMLVVTGFVAFRWFDIRKPGPVKWAEERFERGAGVMADDIVAGFLAAIVVMFPAYVLVAMKLNADMHPPLPAVQGAVHAAFQFCGQVSGQWAGEVGDISRVPSLLASGASARGGLIG
jgi:phosphatidylglycerophosphatase A